MSNFNKYNLNFNKPLMSWDDALPLGNGLLGCLIWGNGKNLKFSLDRADLWDTRQNPKALREDFNFLELKRLIKDNKQEEILNRFDSIYDDITPTKIPVGRIELDYEDEPIGISSKLNIQEAIASIYLTFKEGKTEIKSYLHAKDKYGYIKIQGTNIGNIKEKTHNFTKNNSSKVGNNSLDTSDVSALNYRPAEEKIIDNIKVIIQQTNESLEFALMIGEKVYNNTKEIIYYIANNSDGDDWIENNVRKLRFALERGYDQCIKEHKKWWKTYWEKSSISIPNEKIEKLWYLNTYLFASTSREGCPPMALQGVWTADEGKLPPWKGDYHNDLNTQLSYLHYLKSNRIQEGKAFIDFLWDLLPSARKHAKDFFGAEGIVFPGVMDIKGRPLGGWTQYSFSITSHIWLCEMFHEYWLYTGDEEFLRDKAYIFLKETAQVVLSILEEDKLGYYNLPISTSPEFHDNTLEAWLKPTSNYDLAILRYLFKSLGDESKCLGYKKDELLWQRILDKIAPFHISNGVLMINEMESLAESHRHHSHCIGIYPLNLIRYENKDERYIIENTIRNLEKLGAYYWVGYSFVWMAALYTRLKDGENAVKQLEIFNDSITSINGFHINGDYKKHGIGFFTYKIFTLEGNMVAIASIQEMLLQTYDNTIRIFEAIPLEWRKSGTSFRKLRAEGGVLVSATIKNNKISLFEIYTTRDWTFRIKNPFGEGKVVLESSKEKVVLEGEIFDIKGIKDTKYSLYKTLY